MSLQMSPVQSTKDHVADLRSIDLAGIDGRRLQRSKFAGRFAEDGITLSLVHLDVALAVKAEGRDAGDRRRRSLLQGLRQTPCTWFEMPKRRLPQKNSKTPSFGAFPTHLRQQKLRMIPTPRSAPTLSASPS